MKYFSCLSIIGIVILASCNNSGKSEERISVYCAASLSNVINDLKSGWEDEQHQNVVLNLASSGTLARQIEYGAEADIFLSANDEWMEYVVNISRAQDHPKTIAKNKLVVIAPVKSDVDSMNYESFMDFLMSHKAKISIGDPGHVPLGKYTKESLDAHSIFDELISQFILAKDARNALRFVELEEASIGFVYLTDALSSSKVKIIAVVPADAYDEISYEAILLNDQNDSALSFFQYLTSENSRKIWLKYGFIP